MGLKNYQPPAPANNDQPQFKMSDHIGRLVAINPSSVETVDTKYGLKDAIKADITICDGLSEGLDFADVLIFNAAIVDKLTDDCGKGEITVARVAERVAKNGNTFINLATVTDEDMAHAATFFVEKKAPVHEAGF